MQQHCMQVSCYEVATVTRCVDQCELAAVSRGRLRVAVEIGHTQRMQRFATEE